MKVQLDRFRLSLDSPLRTSSGTIDERRGWVVRVGREVVGYGEATPLPGFTETRDECENALVASTDALERDDAPAAIAAVTGRSAARHALVTALLDRRARKRGRTLYRELGGATDVESVPVQATIGDADREDTVAAAREALAVGFRTLKLKVGSGSLDRDLERVGAVRSTAGEDLTIRVDANGSWDLETADRAIDGLEEHRVSLLEQPLSPTDLEGHRSLRGRIPIAVDETLTSRTPQAVLDAKAADALVLKPMALGGPDVAAGIAHRARRAGLDVIVSNTIDAAVWRTTAVHVAASLPERSAAGLATASMLDGDIAPDPAPVADGQMAVPNGPGLGIEEVSIDA